MRGERTRAEPRPPAPRADGRVGVAGVAAYAPRYRVDAETVREAWGRFDAAGIRSSAVPAADEDALTMATEAAERALDAAGVAAGEIEALAFGTSTPPVAATDLTPRLGEFLGVPATAVRRYLTGSARAGTEAFAAAVDAGRFPALVVAADCPRGEPDSPEGHAAGAGAAAFVLTDDGPTTLEDRAEYGVDYPGTRFRRAGSESVEGLGVTAYDREAYTEAVRGAVEGLEDATAGAVALGAPDGRLPYRAAKALDIDPEAVRRAAAVHDLGDAGAAGPLLSLARALAGGATRTLVVGYGDGAGADALLFSGDAPPVDLALGGGESVSYADYLRLRGEIVGDPPAGGGAMVSVPSWRRSREARYRLVAGRCPACEALAFPAEGACPSCGALSGFERVELSRRGAVETVTTVSPGGAPPEFARQGARGGEFATAIVAFDAEREEEEGRASVPMQVTDADPERVGAGDAVEAVVRRIYTQEGVTRYGRKARPVR
ncbi:zinc ribbon domain-containing protein [Halegenticoccus tardaugens]|uniref:zinc ribbon domain-containing protein n=1 Tax=Halegenticoccus tardaugens TaxID=2071624 RepID=UPI00100A2D71|nr:zinc ribbon domain-containing protein [Halegenticoccus tardaugens]